MGWQLTVQAVPLFVATLIVVVLTAVAVSKRDIPGSKQLAVLVGIAGLWSLTAGLELFNTAEIWGVILTKGSYVAIAIGVSVNSATLSRSRPAGC